MIDERNLIKNPKTFVDWLYNALTRREWDLCGEEVESIVAAWKEAEKDADGFSKIDKARPIISPLAGAVRSQRWISADDALPEDGRTCLVAVDGAQASDSYLGMRVAWLDLDFTPPVWVFDGRPLQGVTHWMELPARPVVDDVEKEKAK